MPVDLNDFFSYTKRNYSLTEEDYLAVLPYVQSAEAFARITNQSIYIVDYYKQGFLYVSPNPLFLCGKTPADMLREGYNFYFQNITPKDLELLLEINTAGFEFYASVPAEDRLKYFISYDVQLIQPNNLLMMINHKLTPILLDKHSNLWLGLSVVSRSSAKKSGNIYMSKYGSDEIHHYDLSNKIWRSQSIIKLSTQEKDILTLSSQGFKNDQIAERLFLSTATIKFHKNNLFKKIGVKNISEAIVFATNHKLI